MRDRTGWTAGFVIGARGEIVFGTKGPPSSPLEVRLGGNKSASAEVLAFDPKLRLGLARIAARRAPPREPLKLKEWAFRSVPVDETFRTVPVEVGPPDTLKKETWTLVLSVDEDGAPEPFAGVVLREAAGQRPFAIVMASARPGSAVLDVSGRLIGVALDEGRRRTRVVPFEVLAPFLRRAGERPR